MDKIFVKMILEKETKGYLRYAETCNPGENKIGKLYIKKETLPNSPKEITITIE